MPHQKGDYGHTGERLSAPFRTVAPLLQRPRATESAGCPFCPLPAVGHRPVQGPRLPWVGWMLPTPIHPVIPICSFYPMVPFMAPQLICFLIPQVMPSSVCVHCPRMTPREEQSCLEIYENEKKMKTTQTLPDVATLVRNSPVAHLPS
jgi:hypothetical protein